jgi:hypothetical protein
VNCSGNTILIKSHCWFTPWTEIFLSAKERFMALIRELKDICPPQTNKRFLDHLESFAAQKTGVFDVDDLKPYWAREDFPSIREGKLARRWRSQWRRLRAEIHDLCAGEAYSMFNPYVVLFKELLSCFGRLSKRDDVSFF